MHLNDSPSRLSVVLPVFNEQANLAELYGRLVSVADGLCDDCEFIFVDDGSVDGSLDVLRELARADARVRVLSFSRNFGHQAALTAGLDHATGDAVVLMDSDLQDPPELLPELVARWREGYDVVAAQRRARPGESVFKRGSAYLFYRVMRRISSVDILADAGDFRLLSRRAADGLRRLGERRRFLRGLVAWAGFRQARVFYERPARRSGESKYSLKQMLRRAHVGVLAFSNWPVAVIGVAGGAACVGGLVAAAWGAPLWNAGGLFLAGVQLLALWVLGQYLALIADEVRGRPTYLVRESLNPRSQPDEQRVPGQPAPAAEKTEGGQRQGESGRGGPAPVLPAP